MRGTRACSGVAAAPPALPAGLALNTSTGMVTGTPTALTAGLSSTITVTATTGGKTTCVLKLTVFALSDNNALHIAHIRQLFRERYPNREFLELFDKCYLSQVTGHTQGTGVAWRDILDEQGLKAEACLFVDDHKPHLDRARKLGFHVFHFTPGTRMGAVLDALEGRAVD